MILVTHHSLEEEFMEKQLIEITGNFVSPGERARLVRLCISITGDVDAAEDLVQETLLEAWQHEHVLRDHARRTQWLSGIARNVCLRWLRKRGRDAAHLLDLHADQEAALPDLEDCLADDFDIDIELERKELVELLDRAMALLPPETRTVLIKRYVEESPLAQVADQLGINVSAVAMRLQRGKLALRRILATELRHEIAPYNLQPAVGDWEVTPLWCHYCGMNRLLGKRSPGEGKLLFKCPACSPGIGEVLSYNHLPVLKGVKGFKPLASRLLNWCDSYYWTALRSGSIPCLRCGRVLPVLISRPEDLPDWARTKDESPGLVWNQHERFVTIPCPSCFSSHRTTLEALVLCLPEGRQFLQAHPKIRILPRQQVEVDGHLAIVTRYESITASATLTAISVSETYKVLRIYGGSQ